LFYSGTWLKTILAIGLIVLSSAVLVQMFLYNNSDVITGKPETVKQLDQATAELNEQCSVLENLQRSAVRAALVEERSRICLFVGCLKPVMVRILHSH